MLIYFPIVLIPSQQDVGTIWNYLYLHDELKQMKMHKSDFSMWECSLDLNGKTESEAFLLEDCVWKMC